MCVAFRLVRLDVSVVSVLLYRMLLRRLCRWVPMTPLAGFTGSALRKTIWLGTR